MYCIERSVKHLAVVQKSKGLAFVMLLLPMISLHMLTFRMMVTMVSKFGYFIFLIHNTLLGEIMISSIRTTTVNEYEAPPENSYKNLYAVSFCWKYFMMQFMHLITLLIEECRHYIHSSFEVLHQPILIMSYIGL